MATKKRNGLFIGFWAAVVAVVFAFLATMSTDANASDTFDGQGELYTGAIYSLAEMYSTEEQQQSLDLGVKCQHLVTIQTSLKFDKDGNLFEQIHTTMTDATKCASLVEKPLLMELQRMGLKIGYLVADDLSFKMYEVQYPEGTTRAKCEAKAIMNTAFIPDGPDTVKEIVTGIMVLDRQCLQEI